MLKVVLDDPVVAADGKALEAEVDADLAKYSAWLEAHLKDKPLAPSEKAILKTYLWWKVKGENDGAQSSG